MKPIDKAMPAPGAHPADDPLQVKALDLAIGVRDRAVARSIARDILLARDRWEAAHGAPAEREP